MKLIPEQVSFLRKEIRRLERENKYNLAGNLSAVANNNYKINEYTNLLKMSDYVKEVPVNEIGIGTKFALQFEGEEEIENYILVDEKLIGHKMLLDEISAESSMGKKIIGKKEGDKVIGATIVKIYNDRRDNLSYLSDFQFEYTEPFKLTSSQVELLKIEEIRNQRAIRLFEPCMGAATDRVVQIKELLENISIANPTGDYIETGSVFDITLFVDDEEITKSVQLIDRVVSTELENEYVVKNSDIGKAVTGLKEQDEFIVNIEGKEVTGVVFNIRNNFIDIKENVNSNQKRI